MFCNSGFLDFELFAAQVFESQSLFKAGQSLFQFETDLKYHVVSCGCCGRRWRPFDFVWGWRHYIWFVQGLKVDLEGGLENGKLLEGREVDFLTRMRGYGVLVGVFESLVGVAALE
jgi:hypothetical protein